VSKCLSGGMACDPLHDVERLHQACGVTRAGQPFPLN
jgi:hypothetical protein